MELEQPLALAYVLCLYKSYWSHISEVDLVNLVDWDHWKIARYVVAYTRK